MSEVFSVRINKDSSKNEIIKKIIELKDKAFEFCNINSNENELVDQDIKELYEKAKDSELEAKYLLNLAFENGHGAAYDKTHNYKVLDGEIYDVCLQEEERINSYDSADSDYLIIPLSKKIVLLEYYSYNDSNRNESWEKYHIFTPEGWKEIQI